MSYTKNRSTQFVAICYIIQDDWNPSNNNTRSAVVRGVSRVMTGNENPNWRKQIAAGENATTSLSGTYQSIDGATSGNFHTVIDGLYGGRKTFKVSGHIAVYLGTYYPWGTWTSFADARASNRFLSKIRSAAVQVSGPTFLGEMREALQMIKKPAAGLQDSIKRYLDNVKRAKRQRGRKPNDWMGDLGNLWLENSFGWQPLMNDIQSGIDAYNSLFEKTRVIRISAGGSDTKMFANTVSSMTLPGTGSWYAIDATGTKCSNTNIVRYRGALRSQAATTARDRFARFGFTPSEFVPTAWELLPWSFLIDYFASVGDVLSGAVTDTSNVLWVNRSEVKKTQVVYSAKPRTPRSDWPTLKYNDTSSPSLAVFNSKSVSRSAGIGVPTPKLSFQIPSTDGKLANIAALLAQARSSIHPQNPSRRNYRL